LDVFVNFLTTFENSALGINVADPKLIAINYVTGWFFPDFLACVPVDKLLDFSANGYYPGESTVHCLDRLAN
jgi:hypothetical protein